MRVWRNREKILASDSDAGKRVGNTVYRPVLEARVLRWLELVRGKNIRLQVSASALCVTAGKIAKSLLRAPLTELTDVEKRRLKDWTASDSWVQRFGQRNNLVSVALHGAAGDVDLSDPGLVKRIAEIKETCAKFSLQCVYNVDEFGLFYRCLPRRTYLAPSESSTKRKRRGARGTKQTRMKDRVTGWACTNADGTRIVPVSVIGKTAHPRCFTAAGIKKPLSGTRPNPNREGLPLPYFQQRKAWADSIVMGEWYRLIFLPFVRKAHPDQKVLLLMDNCGSHSPQALQDVFKDPEGQVTICALPPNTRSKLQPMDAGIIAFLKTKFKYRLLELLLDGVEDYESRRVIGTALKAGTAGVVHAHLPHMLDALEILKFASDHMTPLMVSRCWLKCGILSHEQQTQLKEWINFESTKTDNPTMINNPACADGGPIEPSLPAVEDNGNNYDDVIRRLKNLSIPEYPEGANVNEHCLAACAEAQRTVADENAKSLLEEWQQLDDRQAVVDSVLAEFADEIGSNDEPEEILELDDDDNEEDVIEQPAASMSGVKVAAARAIHSVKTVTSSEIESMPWAKVKPLLAAMHAWSHMVVRSVRNVPPGLVGKYHKFEKDLLNSTMPKCKQAKISSFVTKKRLREIAMANIASEDLDDGTL
eukprot:INCI5043.4.p1 GENE.INCI5043.4~~INCI5043.4.p1  ORF type:complete len:649 (-),score=98.48 INCI5043.4:808-2754(-)